MTIFEFYCYREFLCQWLERKKEKNPSYSQRALAKFLSLGQPRLSEILNKKGHLSASSAKKIAAKLFTTCAERDYFTTLRDLAVCRGKGDEAKIKTYLSQLRVEHLFTQVNLDQHEISNWYDYGILFMLQMNPTIPITAIAAYLDLSDDVVQDAVIRLQRQGALLPGTWTINPQFRRIKGIEGHKARINFHRAMISKSLHAMHRYPENLTGFQSYLFTMKREHFTELAKAIKDFSFSNTDQGEARNHDSLYCLSYQLFPIAKDVGHLMIDKEP